MIMKESTITLDIRLEIGIRRDGDEYVAWCIALDVFSQGKSKDKAVASLKEAVELWFESCLQRGVLDQALREAGFVQGPPPVDVVTNTVHLRREQQSNFEVSGGFARDYIEVSVPAYIAAHNVETSAPC